jgi:hypothetical protein
MKHLFTLLALFSFSLFAQTVPNYVPTNGLVGWWPFNGNANDLSGNGNNGTVNGATPTSDMAGQPGMAYHFDGVNDFIQTPNKSLSGSVTFSAWYKMANYNTPGNDMFFASNQSTSTSVHSSNIAFGFRSYQGQYGHSTYVGSPLNGYYATNNLPTANVWHHLVCVFENGQYLKIYLDNILVYSNFNVISRSNLPSLPILIGGTGTSNLFYYSGQLDEVGIWERALSAFEINELFLMCNDSLALNPTSTNATLGSNATFNALSSASGATYQWQAKNGSNFVNMSNAGQFSGATSSTLTVTSVSSANNGLQVRSIVDHGDCVDTSNVATLTACFDLTNQPSDRYVVAGTSTTFGLTTNDPSNCTYQWQTNSGFGYQNLSNAGQYSGTTSSTLAVASVSAANNNQLFRCIVTAGTCKDTTSEARIILSGVGVSENSLQRVSVFPNPTRGLVDLGVALEGTYTLIGIDGRAVQTGVLRQILDFSNQPAGVYSLRLETPAGNRVVKVVKE